ncbi:YiiX/YebB-like N1pC/P60 family cysteine hydrolase [Polyangium sp. 6x1]|uniref:YiiX/YebB-like N1pC/P60 family cysteine hydrolase n=1 Tax=Polyangium sp. 6x1 TaxID=3042689 RepID=UPI0024829666|nr:YiiX/YebB-like N1pC/P60 family cysteine hydrolase [Polyangium sp. 6x1]MDI1450332.1 YiiX/YebB-like N1pC/P60 family cysteine hydrolase [Polyangium sp. 6x1]
MSRRRAIRLAALLVVVAVAFALWRRNREEAGYPFTPDLPGAAGALARLAPPVLDRAEADDVAELDRVIGRLDAALRNAEAKKALLTAERIDDLRAEDRGAIRDVWSDALDPLLALDTLKHRYQGFWSIDYKSHPRLHARAYALAFAALCAEVEAGHRLIELVGGREVAPTLFDEAREDLGLPAGTFGALRKKLARSRDLAMVPAGEAWFATWIERHLDDEGGTKLAGLTRARTERAKARLGVEATANVARNKAEVLRGEAFERWFPVQKNVAEWFGDTRVVAEDRRLISDAQIATLGETLRPGDIIVERRNWYLSNVGLPGFWPHAALYVGSPEDIKKTFDEDPETRARFGVFSEHLARERARGWKELGEKDTSGHPHTVIEAVSEGVVAASLEHSCGADYVGALRPRLPLVEIAAAIDRTLGFVGRPYDFNFDFGTDDELVCSELVIKAYEPKNEGAPGLRVPFVSIAGRRAVPPTELVRLFAAERSREDRQLDFVYFLDGRERKDRAIVADADALAASARRPKWDIAQP